MVAGNNSHRPMKPTKSTSSALKPDSTCQAKGYWKVRMEDGSGKAFRPVPVAEVAEVSLQIGVAKGGFALPSKTGPSEP